MKLKKAHIIVESVDETSERWKKVLKSKTRSQLGEEVITVSSWEILARGLAPFAAANVGDYRTLPSAIDRVAWEVDEERFQECWDGP